MARFKIKKYYVFLSSNNEENVEATSGKLGQAKAFAFPRHTKAQ